MLPPHPGTDCGTSDPLQLRSDSGVRVPLPYPPQLALQDPGQPVQMYWAVGTEQNVPRPLASANPPEFGHTQSPASAPLLEYSVGAVLQA